MHIASLTVKVVYKLHTYSRYSDHDLKAIAFQQMVICLHHAMNFSAIYK